MVEQPYAYLSQEQGAQAKAHHHDSGTDALFIGIPHSRDGKQHVVGQPTSKPDEPAVKDIQLMHRMPIHPAAHHKTAADQHSRCQQQKFYWQPPQQESCQQAPQAETAHC